MSDTEYAKAIRMKATVANLEHRRLLMGMRSKTATQ